MDETCLKLEEGLKQPGFQGAQSLYQALLSQQRQALKALEKRDELQQKLEKTPNAPTSERQRWEKGIAFIEMAIANLNKPKEDQESHYRDFIKQTDIREYSVIGDLYRTMLIKESNIVNSYKRLVLSKKQMEIYNQAIDSAMQNSDSQHDDTEFGNKLKAYIEARVYVGRQVQMQIDDMKAICDYYDSIAVIPLRQILSQNQEAIASIEDDLAIHQTFSDQKKN